MQERFVKGLQFNYVEAQWSGTNTSGVLPIGKRILVMMDTMPEKSQGGVIITDTKREIMSMAAETGTLVAIGPEAFKHHHDGTTWISAKPVPGRRIYVEKYAGLEIMGDDGQKYRLMDDGCAGAIFVSAGEAA